MSPRVSHTASREQPVTPGIQSTVFGIIDAFTSGRDVLKKFRAQDRDRRRGQPRQDSLDEIQLTKSLRNSPTEIHDQYERGYNAFSSQFADGDVVAQAALTRTLLKLNTGLVEIVSTFLANPKSKSHCDFSPLIKLSDESRREAVDALTQLYQRLSRSQAARRDPSRHLPQEGKSKHTRSCKQSSSPHDKNQERPRRPSSSPRMVSKAQPSNTTVSKIAVRGVKAPQYAFVRQRPAKRSGSGSSASSGSSSVSTSSKSSQSTALTQPSTSPSSSPSVEPRQDSPPPRYVSDAEADQQNSRQQPAIPRRRIPEPQIRQASHLYNPRAREPEMVIRAPTTSPLIPPMSPPSRAVPTLPIRPVLQTNYSMQELPVRTRMAAGPPTRPPVSYARQSLPRVDGNRASVAYSFASDSTKLGEIPLHKWNEPFDFDAMERLNKEAALHGWLPTPPVPEPAGRRKGFWNLFKKGNTGL